MASNTLLSDMTMDVKQKGTILAFLGNSPLAVISTKSVNSGYPESALVAFAELPTFEIIFETFHTARKYKNLQNDGHISLAVGWDIKQHITLQYEGIARELERHERQDYTPIFYKKDTPCTKRFLEDPRARLFKVKPTWLRYSDYTGNQPSILEFVFGNDGSEPKRG